MDIATIVGLLGATTLILIAMEDPVTSGTFRPCLL